MSEYAIRVKNISKSFNIHHEKRDSVFESVAGFFQKGRNSEVLHALDNVSFDVKQGEIFGIVGPNGSGKSTLLRIISKIYAPDSGSVEVNGTIIPILALGLGFHPEFTAITNIYQSSILLGFKKNVIDSRVKQIIEFAELEKFADTKVKNFSNGMLMRLAFATSVLVDPDILIVDEVLAVGDINFQKKCIETIKSFKERGKAIILVSHTMEEVRNYADRVMFLNQSKVMKIGSPDDVISAYTDFCNKREKLGSLSEK